MGSIFGTRKVTRERRLIAGLLGEPVSFAPFVQKSIDISSTDFVLESQDYAHLFKDQVSGSIYCHIYIGTSTSGDTLTIETPFGDTITYVNIAQGQWYRMAITKVLKTGTTVGDLVIGL